MTRICFLVAFSVAVLSANVLAEEFVRSLHGMQGLSIKCDTEAQLSLVKSLEDNLYLDFLSISKNLNDETKVLVTADYLDEFKNLLNTFKISYQVFIEDVEKEVQEDYLRNELAKGMSRAKDSSYAFTHFPRFSEIESFLKDLAGKYSDIAQLITIGKSFEGRPIYVLKISSGGSDKPAILLDAGIHAREWIAPTTALYTINQLVVNKTNSELYKNVDWYILPSLNPDGYEYTHTNYRLWRKTRSTNSVSSCPGTDANRNFGYKWMVTGASSNPCSDIYAGKQAFSEPETQSLQKFVLSLKKSVKLYLTLHSYGQYLLHPWGFTEELPENEPQLREVAVAAEKALAAVRGTRYTIGSSTNVLYAAAGGSDDWVMAVGGAPLSYTVELPGGGNAGFNPPPSSIKPVGFETFEAFKVFAKYTASKYA